MQGTTVPDTREQPTAHGTPSTPRQEAADRIPSARTKLNTSDPTSMRSPTRSHEDVACTRICRTGAHFGIDPCAPDPLRDADAMRYTLLCAVSLLALASVALAAAPCRFAPSFDAEAIFSDPATQSEFIQTVMMRENHFLQPTPCPLPPVAGQDLTNIGFHAVTGMTLDGHRWTVEEGLPYGEPHLFTAASKESLHLAMIALALQSGESALPAQLFFSPSNPSNASAVVLDVLATKVNTIDAFFETYPGFGGFLPWVFVSDAGLTPTTDFNSSVPSLDNGQMFWGAYAVAKTLSRDYPDVLHRPLKRASTSNDDLYLSPTTTLAQRWTNIYTRMITNALIVFYDSRTNSTLGQLRTVSKIADRTMPIDPTMSPYEASANYLSAPGETYLNDPYEGELFTNMAFLFSDWSWTGASSDSVWVYKRAMLQSVEFQVQDPSDPSAPPTTINVERGYWFSGHEKWKFFLNPYLSSSWSRKVFAAGEKARSWNSVQQSLAGGFASCAGMAETDQQDTGYKNDCGIQSLAFESVGNTDILSPYAFAALMLASPSHGLAWYHNLLLAPRAQTCFGSLEALNRTGANIAPLCTWDTKVTTLLTMSGGLQSMLAVLLAEEPVNAPAYNEGAGGSGVPIPANVTTTLDLFVFAVDREWSRVFAGLPLGEELDYARPQVQIAAQLEQWSSCRDDTDVCQCSAESLKHQKAMAEAARGVDSRFEEQKAAAESRRPAVDPMQQQQQLVAEQ